MAQGVYRSVTEDTNGLQTAAIVFLVSVALIALQLFYMRALSVLRYHHFSYLVISTALLGFGASGTLLSLFLPVLRRRFRLWTGRLLLLFTLSIPGSYLLARLLPLDIRYILYSNAQLALLGVYNLLVLLPFLFGALLIGLFLSYYAHRIPLLYGINLFGSGIGGLSALGFMFLMPAEQLPLVTVLCAFAAQLLWWSRGGRRGWRAWAGGALGLLLCSTPFIPLPVGGVDQYKSLATMERLERQGDAQRMVTRYSPRMRLDVYRAPSLHHTLFAGPSAREAPPPQDVILFDGETAGALFRIDSPREAGIMDATPQSLPYRLLPQPDTLLLGEVGGGNIWLAKRFGAPEVTAVQASETLLAALRGALRESGGGVFSAPGVRTVELPPRLYLERRERRYDIIHVAGAEGMPAASGGLQSLHENYLLTVEGIGAALGQLKQGGFLAFTRGIQTPPRDNIKISALAVEALRARGVKEPERHILQARNYLAVTTLVSNSAIEAESIEAFTRACEQLDMDIEFYPGIEVSDLTHRNRIEGPQGKPYSYYHHALRELLGGRGERFHRSWAYNVEAPTDNRPYFHNFFKWESLDRLLESYQGSFLRHVELGYVVLVFTLAEIVVLAFVLILLPLAVGRNSALRTAQVRGYRLPTLLFFTAIGFGFMFLEMVLIQKLSLFLGDPIYSASAVITAILLCAGVGSAMQGRVRGSPRGRAGFAAALVLLLSVSFAAALDPLLSFFIHYALPLRYGVALAFIAPLSFCMGWLLPSGMQLVRGHAEELIPWAWGINGFASVAAGPLAVLLAIELGFIWVFLLAAACYALAGVAAQLWPGR